MTVLCRLFVAVLGGLAVAAASPPSARGAELDCVIEPKMVVGVGAAVEGLLEKILVDRGDLVREGQELAALEASVERATVALARARTEIQAPTKAGQVRVEFGGRRLAREEQVFREGGISEKEMDETATAKALAEVSIQEAGENLRLARFELERAEAALEVRTVRSPVTGVVMERLLSPGEYVKQAPILKLAQLDPLRVEVFAPLALMGKVAVGMTAQVLPEGPVRAPYIARVTVVDRVADAASGTFGVRLELPNPDYRLPAGLKCKVRLPEQGTGALEPPRPQGR